MRKTILFGLAAAMLATACSEEDDLRQGIAGEGITFTSSVMSRATDTSFEAGDAIGVSMYTESGFVENATNVQYTSKDGKAFTSTNPMTWGAAGSAKTVGFKGVYPYKAGAVVDGIYSFTLATGERASLSNNDVMYSSTTDATVGAKNVNLTFKHKLVKVVMQVYDQDRNPLSDATVKINKQQTSGTLDLADGTVTSTGAADATLNFASNSDVSGEYQTIVMPSDATQGRVITITYNGVDYPCPVDIYAFESGNKMTFSVTLNPESGTASQGTIVNATATVQNWTEQRIESGWIFGEGESFKVEGKISYRLLTEPTVLSTNVSHFGNFGNKQLDATDVYSLEYKRDNAADDATITISGKDYTLQKGLTAGTLLIAAGDNKKGGIDVTSEDEGIELTSVLVYTNVGLPITLWEGDGTPGNGTAGETGIESAGWKLPLARFTLNDQQLKMLTPGAILRCYFDEGVTEESQAELLWLGTLRMHFNGSLGSFDINSHSLINVVTLSMCDEVAVNNGEMIFVKDWSELSLQLNRIELVPNTDEESNYSNLLWCHMIEQEEIGKENDGDCWLDNGTLKMGVPASLKSGDIIKVTYVSASEGAYFEGVPEPQGSEAVIFNKSIETEGDGVAEIAVNEEICQRLLELRENREGFGIKSLTIKGNGVAIHKIQLVRGSGE